MKKNVFLILCSVVIGLLFTSCDVNKPLHRTEVRLIEPSSGIISTPIVMEIKEVSSTKVIDTITFSLLYTPPKSVADGILKKVNVDNIEDYQKIAFERFIEKNKCDIAICVRYQYDLSNDGKILKVIISGYPAYYSSIRPATVNDSWMLNFMGQGDEILYIHTDTTTLER